MLGFFTTIVDAAEGAGEKAEKLEQQSKQAQQRLKELDDRLKRGVISKQAYDKLAKAERATARYLAQPLKGNRFQKYSAFADLFFWGTAFVVIGSTFFLMYKYRDSSKPPE